MVEQVREQTGGGQSRQNDHCGLLEFSGGQVAIARQATKLGRPSGACPQPGCQAGPLANSLVNSCSHH